MRADAHRPAAASTLHAEVVRLQVAVAQWQSQAVRFRRYGARHRLRPGWNRPEEVDVLHWGATWCRVRCTATGRRYVFPAWQLEGFERRVMAGHETYDYIGEPRW